MTDTAHVLPDLAAVRDAVDSHRHRGSRIVLTSGSFDLLHIGHLKYLDRARSLGGVLIVGVDDDAKIRERKGKDRPMVPEEERVAMLTYQRPVDYIYVKRPSDPAWSLILAVAPDVLVLTEDHSYTPQQVWDLTNLCGEVTVLPRQAKVTTSERLRQMHMNMGHKLGPALAEALPDLIDNILKKR